MTEINWNRLPEWTREDYLRIPEEERVFYAQYLNALAEHDAQVGPVWRSIEMNRALFNPDGPLQFVLELMWRGHSYLCGVEPQRSTSDRRKIANPIVKSADRLALELNRRSNEYFFRGYPEEIQSRISEAIRQRIRLPLREELELVEHELGSTEIQDLLEDIEDAVVLAMADLKPLLDAVSKGATEWANQHQRSLTTVIRHFIQELSPRLGGAQYEAVSIVLSAALGREVTLDAVENVARRSRRDAANGAA